MRLASCLIVALIAVPQSVGGGEAMLEVGKFSTAAPGSEFPDNWKPLRFKKKPQDTAYSLVRDGDVVVVQAVSQATASGLIREITINPRDYPIVQWRWKISNVLQKGDVTRKEGDDYPARLYITFAYDAKQVGLFDKAKYETARLLYGQYPPIGAINYIWTSKEPVGTVVPNVFTDRAKMIVLQSGGPLNTWVSEQRNILDDYRRAFGEESPVPMISGVAVMTDTDNTGEAATAYFGDIVFRTADPQPSSYRK
jgi:hypothetical protein